MNKPFRTVGYILLALSGVILLFGLWTFSFEKTQGELLTSDVRSVRLIGEFPNTLGRLRLIPDDPTVQDDSAVSQQFVSYRYSVDGSTYTAKRIGMGYLSWTLSPFVKMKWETDVERGQMLTVYYYRSDPSISVLHRGFDVGLVLVFLFAGWVLIAFSKWIDSHG